MNDRFDGLRPGGEPDLPREAVWLDDPGVNRSLVGGKFFSLWQLARRGLPVPAAFCVLPRLTGGADGRRLVEAAAARLAGDRGTRLAVRSSAVDEDRPDLSRAGWYRSQLNLEPEQVWRAVRDCSRPPGGGPIPVFVQEMVRPRVAGGLFTQHPGLPVPGALLVEAVVGLGDRLLAGDAAVRARYVYLPAGGWRAEASDDLLSAAELDDLLRLALRVESIQGCARDLEWALDRAGRFRLLQSRPITALPPDLVPLAAGRALAGPYHVAGTGADASKVAVRTAALDLDGAGVGAAGAVARGPFRVRPQRIWLLRYPRGTRFRRKDLRPLFDTTLVQVDDEVVPWRDLPRALAAPAAGETREGIVHRRVKDYPVARISGVSSRLADGSILVEYGAGAGLGVARGLVPASGLIVAADGAVVSQWRVPQPERHVFNGRLNRFVSRPYGRPPHLDERAVPFIVRLTRRITDSLPEARVEWWIVGSRIYLVDLAVESRSLSWSIRPPGDDTITWISPGRIRGRVVWLDDIEGLRVLCERVGMDTAAAMVRDGAGLEQSLGLRLPPPRGGRVVVAAALPVVALFPLVPRVAGFLFASGSILCHLGTLLREAGVPAAIAPHLARTGGDGHCVDLCCPQGGR